MEEEAKVGGGLVRDWGVGPSCPELEAPGRPLTGRWRGAGNGWGGNDVNKTNIETVQYSWCVFQYEKGVIQNTEIVRL